MLTLRSFERRNLYDLSLVENSVVHDAAAAIQHEPCSLLDYFAEPGRLIGLVPGPFDFAPGYTMGHALFERRRIFFNGIVIELARGSHPNSRWRPD